MLWGTAIVINSLAGLGYTIMSSLVIKLLESSTSSTKAEDHKPRPKVATKSVFVTLLMSNSLTITLGKLAL